jgi:hypothetical protein
VDLSTGLLARKVRPSRNMSDQIMVNPNTHGEALDKRTRSPVDRKQQRAVGEAFVC